MAALLVSISPLPWFFATPASASLVLFSNIISGSSWPVSDVCQQNLYLSHSPQVYRSMYIAVFLASINIFGIALGNAFGGWLMQNPFAALAQQHYVFLGMSMNSTRYMFLATIVLRLLVMFVLLPRISEEGAWTLSDTLKDITCRTRDGYRRRLLSLQVEIIRRKERRRIARVEKTNGKEG